MDPNAVYPAGFPVPTQSPPNPMAFYQNSVPQYPQSKTPIQPGHQQHSFGTIQLQPGGPTGAMVPSGFPQQPNAAMDNFSTSFTQPPVPAGINQFSQPGTSTNTPSTVAQTFSQNMASLSANNMLPNQQKPPHMNPQMSAQMNAQVNAQMNQHMNQHMNPQMNHQMPQMNNSPHVTQPGTPVQAQGQGQAPTAAQIQAQMQSQGQGPNQVPQIQSPAQAQAQAQAAAREKARVTTLLDINSTLLQEVLNLQSAGKAGTAANADPNTSGEQGHPPGQKPSQEYIDCMRRLQANLAYLATIADRTKKASGVTPPAPAIMTAPSNVPAVKDLYAKLNELFPNSGKASTPQKLSPGTTHGNGGPSPSPVSESVV